MNEFLSRSRSPQPERGVRDRALKSPTIFALMAPQFPPSTRRARSRRDYSSNPFSRLLRGRFNLEGKWHCRHLESRKAVRRGGRLDAGAGPAHPRASAPLTDPGSKHAARYPKGTSVRSANPWADPCTATFAHEGRQPWPPARAHSPDKLPVAFRSKHSPPAGCSRC